MHSIEEAKRAVSMLNNMTFMGMQIRVKMNHRPAVMRSGSWDGTVAEEDPDLIELVSKYHGSDGTDGRDTPSKNEADPCKPLVVDGSGQRRSSLEMLSTSAPA